MTPPQIRFVDEQYDREWELEWHDMPEFKQENKDCYHTLTVRFETAEDLKKFEALVEQKIDVKTKSIWYPKLIRGQCDFWRYVDES
jgi:hypothetical protein